MGTLRINSTMLKRGLTTKYDNWQPNEFQNVLYLNIKIKLHSDRCFKLQFYSNKKPFLWTSAATETPLSSYKPSQVKKVEDKNDKM